MYPVGPGGPVPPPPPMGCPDEEERVDTMRVETMILLEFSVLPVSVEKVVRDRPGTTMVDAKRVETVSVEFTIMVLELREETPMVEATREDPVSVENWDRENPGTVREDALMVETAMLCVVMEDPTRVE